MSLDKYDIKTMSADEDSVVIPKMESIVVDNVVTGRELGEESLIFGRMILHTFDRYPDFAGMVNAETGEKTTFAEMKDRSIRCALWLRKRGVGENDVVGLSTPIQMNDYVPYLAALYVNAIVNPWSCGVSAEKAQHFFETCRPKKMFACSESIDELAEIAGGKGIDCKFVAFERHPDHVSLEEIMAEQTQDEVDKFECTVPSEPAKKASLILFSSGTTGPPKAIMLSYRSLFARQMEEIGMRSGMNCLWYSTLAWVVGGIMTMAAIRLRCTRIVHEKFDAEVTASIIGKYKINYIFWLPYYLMLCHQADVFNRYDFAHVEIIAFAGAKINRAILDECQKSLSHVFVKGGYGLTEAGGFVSRQTKNCKHIDSVGYVRSGVKLKVVNRNNGAVLGPNEEGEIYVKSDTAMLGYLNNPEETNKAFDEDGWLRSGDTGSYDQDGEIIVSDRLKAVIKTRCFIVSPYELQDILMQHPAVGDCAVVRVEHPIDVERPFAFVLKASGAEVTAQELLDFAASKDECYRLTGGLAFVDELPYTHTGKIHLHKLQNLARAHIEQQRVSQ